MLIHSNLQIAYTLISAHYKPHLPLRISLKLASLLNHLRLIFLWQNLTPSLEDLMYIKMSGLQLWGRCEMGALAIFMRIDDKVDKVLHFMKKPKLTESPKLHPSPTPPPLPLALIQNVLHVPQQPHKPVTPTPTSQPPPGLLDQPILTGLQVK